MLNLAQNEGQILFEVAQTEIPQSIGGCLLDLLVRMVKALQNGSLQIDILAQITANENRGIY